MVLNNKVIESAIPKHQPAADHSFNTHAAATMSVYNTSHILRFAAQSNMCLTMRLLFSDKG